MKIIPIITIILLLLPITSAQKLESYNTELFLQPSGIVIEKIIFVFTLDHDSENVLFPIGGDVQSIKAYKNNKELKTSLTDEGILIEADIKRNEPTQISLEFESKDLIKQSGKDLIFSLNFSLPELTNNLSVVAHLPEGFTLSDIESPISPKPSEISTNGKLITTTWNSKGIKEQSFIIVFKRGYTSRFEGYIAIYAVSIIIIILLMILLFIIFTRAKTRNFISGTLSEDERKVIDYIRKEVGITQKKISQLTGFSKSKMSKITRKLEEKGVVKKKPWFKTNKFDLAKKLR